MILESKRLFGMALVIATLLLIPFITMQFTDEVHWTASDFVLMGSVLLGIGLTYELVARKSEKTAYRIAIGIGLAGAFLLFWVNAAVGIIGNEGQPANLFYGGVLIIGLIGSIIARFKPRGMAITLFVMALSQMLVPVITFLIWPPPDTSWSPSVFGVFVLSGFFAVIFLVSALLFRQVNN